MRAGADLEDLHQDTMMGVVVVVQKERRAGRAVRNIEALVTRVAVNAAISFRRRRVLETQPYDDDIAVAPDSQRGIPTPRAAVLEKWRARALSVVASRMDPELWQVLVLVDIEERTVAEAGDILGVSYATAKSRITRARRQLSELIGPVRAEIERGEHG